MKSQVFKSLLLLSLLAFLATGVFVGCKSTQSLDTPAAPYDVGANSLFWKISGNGLEKPSYLFGTIHLIGQDDFFWPAQLKEQLQTSEQLVLEVSMEEMQNPMLILQQASMEDGKSLKDLLSEKEYERAEAFFKEKVGMGLGMFGKMQPMFLVSMTLPPMLGGKAVSYEQELTKVAKDKEIPVSGLESLEFQMGIFKEIPYEDQARYLMTYIDDFEEQKQQFLTMVASYKQQDINGMLAQVTSAPEFADYQDRLLDDRNKDWIPKMEKLSKEKSVVYAVGAGHLGGAQGVIALLRAKGYTVEAMQ
jgi:uncharacterized protein YbaP (TraB family)